MERNAPAGGRQDAEAELLTDGQLRLVPLTARRFFPRLARDEDLLQCGLIGLWEASRSWSGRGEFSSYACHCILNNMRDYLRAESKALPPPVRQEREQADWYVEDKLIDELDMISRIHAAWPENSRELCGFGCSFNIGLSLNRLCRSRLRVLHAPPFFVIWYSPAHKSTLRNTLRCTHVAPLFVH